VPPGPGCDSGPRRRGTTRGVRFRGRMSRGIRGHSMVRAINRIRRRPELLSILLSRMQGRRAARASSRLRSPAVCDRDRSTLLSPPNTFRVVHGGGPPAAHEESSVRCQARIRRRPLGSGIGSPNSFAVSIHTNRIQGVGERVLLRCAMGGETGKFRRLGDERCVFFAPVDDDFVFDHSLSPSLAFKIIARTTPLFLNK